MQRIVGTIEGTTPLLCNRFHEEAQLQLAAGTRSAFRGDQGTPREQAEPRIYLGQDGKPMIPGPNLFRSFIDAGKFHKVGKRNVTTRDSSLIPGCLSIDEIELPLTYREPWEVDTRSVRNGNTGQRTLCSRPRFDRWRLSFSLTVDETIMTPEFIREIVETAGKRIGLGDFRPDRKGPFGKFVIAKWTCQPDRIKGAKRASSNGRRRKRVKEAAQV